MVYCYVVGVSMLISCLVGIISFVLLDSRRGEMGRYERILFIFESLVDCWGVSVNVICKKCVVGELLYF